MGTICQKLSQNPKVLFEIKKGKQMSGLPALNFEEIREQTANLGKWGLFLIEVFSLSFEAPPKSH